jgi:hypothetical protein
MDVDNTSMFAASDRPPKNAGREENETDMGQRDCVRLAPHGIGKARYFEILWREGS